MVNNSRIVMRNDFKGPGNRPLLRLSRRGSGVFYIPGNQLGYPHAVQPGKAIPVVFNAQGTYQQQQPAVTVPIPGAGSKGDRLGLGFRESAYDPQQHQGTSKFGRSGFFAARGGKCPHCGGKL